MIWEWETKRCSGCKQWRHLQAFAPIYKRGGIVKGLRAACHTCLKTQSQRYYASNSSRLKERAKVNSTKYLYGIDADTYGQLLTTQNGVCAICHSVNENGYRLAVDHNHKTGEVRGLLCSTCNSALGLLHDDPSILRAAADYLEAIPCL
jgi:hypothetical protein